MALPDDLAAFGKARPFQLGERHRAFGLVRKADPGFLVVGAQDGGEAPVVEIGRRRDGGQFHGPVIAQLDLGHRAATAVAQVIADQAGAQDAVGDFLEPRIQRRADIETAFIEAVLADLRILDQFAAHFLGEIVGAHHFGLAALARHQRLLPWRATASFLEMRPSSSMRPITQSRRPFASSGLRNML